MAAPRNVEYFVSRINGYSKNTIKFQPVSSKPFFVANDTLVFRLPTNAIIDLHTLTLQMNVAVACTGGTAATTPAMLPRYSQSLIRRLDVTAGGVPVGLGSLSDYGAINSFLQVNLMGQDKHHEMSVLELGGGPFALPSPAQLVGTATTQSNFQRVAISGWLGVLGGQYM